MKTNLNTLIERRQGEVDNKLYARNFNLVQNEYKEMLDMVESETTQIATEAYRQALNDLLTGLPGDDNEIIAHNEGKDAEWRAIGHNTTLKTVRAQIDDLLGKIE
jgi:hypothetical protein